MIKIFILLLFFPYLAFSMEKSLNNSFIDSFFQGSENQKISFKYLTQPNFEKTLIFVHGTGESSGRYIELGHHFHKLGFNVYLYDQRGFGYSGRFTKDQTKVHTDSFPHLVKDLDILVSNIRKKKNNQKIFLIGHSLGGLITTRYLELFPEKISKAAVTSPMYQFKIPIPDGIVLMIIKVHCFFGYCDMRVYGEDPEFIRNAPYLDVGDTHSEKRFRQYQELVYNDEKNLFLWGVTFKWLSEAIKTAQVTRAEASKIRTPLLILTAGDDYFVDQTAHKSLCETLSSCKQIRFPKSFHSILHEEDPIRDKAINEIELFFREKNSSK